MLKIARVTDTFNIKVYTEDGEYFGDVDEPLIKDNKIYGWKIKATRGSYLAKQLGGAKGVIVPHQLVKSIGDIMIISKAAISVEESGEF